MANAYMTIDASELAELTQWMAARLTAPEFDKLMRRSLNEVGKRSKKPIRQAIQQEYYAPAAFVNAAIKSAKISGGGGSISCIIPLIGEKGNIGSTFGASGGIRGWEALYKKSRISARIVKGKKSTLPQKMTHQGGQPPFINTASTRIAFTRAGASRLPIERISGLAVPQMPINRARPETERAVIDLAEKRVIHNFSRMFG